MVFAETLTKYRAFLGVFHPNFLRIFDVLRFSVTTQNSTSYVECFVIKVHTNLVSEHFSTLERCFTSTSHVYCDVVAQFGAKKVQNTLKMDPKLRSRNLTVGKNQTHFFCNVPTQFKRSQVVRICNNVGI